MTETPGLLAEVLRTPGAFAPIEEAWRALAVARANAFLTPEWARAWLLGDGAALDQEPLVVAVSREGGGLAGVLPLGLDLARRPRAVRFAGWLYGDCFGVAAAAEDEDAVAAAAMRALERELGSPTLILHRVDSDATWPAAARAAAGRRMALVEQSPAELRYTRIAGLDWDGYVATRSKKFGQRIARGLERHLDRDGIAHHVRQTADPAQLDRDLAAFWRLHDLRRPDPGESSVAEAETRARLGEFARAALDRGWLRLRILELDGRPAAGVLCWLIGGRYCVYQSGFDPAWADHKPGLASMNDAVRAAVGEGADEFNMLLGDEEYKERFVSDTRHVHTVSLAPAGSPARLLISAEAGARRRGRRLARRPGIGKVMHAVARRLPGG